MEQARRRQDPDALRAHFLQSSGTTPTRRVWRGAGGPWRLRSEAQDLGSLELAGDSPRTLDSFLAESESTAILVLDRGNVVYERYMHGMRPHDLHVTASMSKSVVGLLGAVLVRGRQLDRGRALHHYVPELAGTAFGDAAVDRLPHMGTAVRARDAPSTRRPKRSGSSLPSASCPDLMTTTAHGPSWNGSRRPTPNMSPGRSSATRTATPKRWPKPSVGSPVRPCPSCSPTSSGPRSVRRRTRCSAFDGHRCEIACGRFAATLSDIARVGELLRCGRALGAHQVLPEEIVRGIPTIPAGPAHDALGPGGRRIDSPVRAYHDFWWVPYNDEGAFVARGRSGQRLYVSPQRETVIAHFGAHVIDPAVPVPQFEHVFRQVAHHLSHGS